MDGTIALTTTVVSGIVALLSAIIAVIKSSKVSRIQAEASLAQERLRAEQERESRAWHDAKLETDRVSTALDEMWQHLQAIRETITKLISEQGYNVTIAVKEIEEESAFLKEGYGKFGSQLSNDARTEWHKAKNLCGDLLLDVHALKDTPDRQSRADLRLKRDLLADIQHHIIRERQHLFESAFREYVRIPGGIS